MCSFNSCSSFMQSNIALQDCLDALRQADLKELVHSKGLLRRSGRRASTAMLIAKSCSSRTVKTGNLLHRGERDKLQEQTSETRNFSRYQTLSNFFNSISPTLRTVLRKSRNTAAQDVLFWAAMMGDFSLMAILLPHLDHPVQFSLLASYVCRYVAENTLRGASGMVKQGEQMEAWAAAILDSASNEANADQAHCSLLATHCYTANQPTCSRSLPAALQSTC